MALFSNFSTGGQFPLSTGRQTGDRFVRQLRQTRPQEFLQSLTQTQPALLAKLKDALLAALQRGGQANLGFLQQEQGGLLDALKQREGLVSGFREEGRDITGGFEERRQQALARLSGLGEQARQDIGAAAKESSARARQGLVASGLSGTSVGGSLERGIQRETGDALAQLNEQLRREQMGVELGTSGDILGARERFATQGLGMSAALSGDTLAAQERGYQSFFQALQQLLQGQLGIAGEFGQQEINMDTRLKELLLQLLGRR